MLFHKINLPRAPAPGRAPAADRGERRVVEAAQGGQHAVEEREGGAQRVRWAARDREEAAHAAEVQLAQRGRQAQGAEAAVADLVEAQVQRLQA